MTRTLCWTLAAVTEKERPLSLLWSSGQQQQQHARLFVFQIPLWVRPLVYATQCLLQLSIQPQTVSLTKECQTPSYDSPDHRLERNAVFSTSIFFLLPFFFCIRGQFGDKHEGGSVFCAQSVSQQVHFASPTCRAQLVVNAGKGDYSTTRRVLSFTGNYSIICKHCRQRHNGVGGDTNCWVICFNTWAFTKAGADAWGKREMSQHRLREGPHLFRMIRGEINS